MSVVAVVYTVLVMYQFNKEDANAVTPAPEVVVTPGSPRRLTRIALQSCPMDWDPAQTATSAWAQGLVNFTMFCAIIMVIDQFAAMVRACRYTQGTPSGNLWYYFAYPDNLFNLATTVVLCMNAGGIVLPNAIGMVARVLARSLTCVPAFCNRVPRDLGEHGEHDNTVCDDNYKENWKNMFGSSSSMWEVVMFIVTCLQLVQTIIMPFTFCQAGPTLAMKYLGDAPVSISDFVNGMDQPRKVVLDFCVILSLFFVVNIGVQLCCAAGSCMDALKEATTCHYLIILLQTACFEVGLPLPLMLGRAVKPSYVVVGCSATRYYKPLDDHTARRYQQALEEYERSKKVAAEEGQGRENAPCGCSRGGIDKWTC